LKKNVLNYKINTRCIERVRVMGDKERGRGREGGRGEREREGERER